MSSVPKESSYDLSRAARISARLRGGTGGAEDDEVSGYVRVSMDNLRFGAPVVDSEPEPEPPTRAADRSELGDFDGPVPWSEEMKGSEGWDRMLDWCVEALDADAAFVVDGRGLTIAFSGDLPREEIDETGARLSVAFEQGDQLSRTLGGAISLQVELDSGWLVGILVPSKGEEKLIFGSILVRPLSKASRRKIAAAFAKKGLGL